MLIELNNVQSRVLQSSDEDDRWLYWTLSWKDKSAKFNPYYKGDGYTHLYDPIAKEFPAGFTRLVIDKAIKENIQFKIQDARHKPCQVDTAADLGWLRDYQAEAVQAGIKRTRGTLWCPTGSGKTEIFVGLTKALPCRWLFLVNMLDLVHQAKERYEERTGLKAGIIADGLWEEERVTMATFQTLYSMLKRGDYEAQRVLSAAQGLAIDEVHTLPAQSYYMVSQTAGNAYYRIGMSGTPLTDDDRSMMVVGACGPVIYRIKPEVLIAAGVLSKPEIKQVVCRQTIQLPPFNNSVKARGKIWHKVNKELVIDSMQRNGLIIKMAQKAAKPCLVFVSQLDHGKFLEREIRSRGMKVEFVHGDKETPERRAAIKRLEFGDIDVLICTVIFNVGVDIPELRSVVIGSGGASSVAAIQRVGRGMRVAQGKTAFQVWDIADEGSLLERHAKARRKAYKLEGYDCEVVTGV